MSVTDARLPRMTSSARQGKSDTAQQGYTTVSGPATPPTQHPSTSQGVRVAMTSCMVQTYPRMMLRVCVTGAGLRRDWIEQ